MRSFCIFVIFELEKVITNVFRNELIHKFNVNNYLIRIDKKPK